MKDQKDLEKQQTESQSDLYTFEEFRKLSAKDVEENWDKVARSLRHFSGKED